jgi:hypothetical protein
MIIIPSATTKKGDDASQKNRRPGRQKTIGGHPKDCLIPQLVCCEEWVSTCQPVADTALRIVLMKPSM